MGAKPRDGRRSRIEKWEDEQDRKKNGRRSRIEKWQDEQDREKMGGGAGYSSRSQVRFLDC